MDNSEFVKRIVSVVRGETIEDTIENLVDPPGRNPRDEDIELSRWFNNLDEENKEIIKKIVGKTVDSTIFGLFTVIDGVRSIEDTADKGLLQLLYERHGEAVLLNDPKDAYLHDIYNSILYDENS